MAYRPPTLLERLALRVLYDLATKVPKVILQRVDEVVPALKIQIVSSASFRRVRNIPMHYNCLMAVRMEGSTAHVIVSFLTLPNFNVLSQIIKLIIIMHYISHIFTRMFNVQNFYKNWHLWNTDTGIDFECLCIIIALSSQHTERKFLFCVHIIQIKDKFHSNFLITFVVISCKIPNNWTCINVTQGTEAHIVFWQIS